MRSASMPASERVRAEERLDPCLEIVGSPKALFVPREFSVPMHHGHCEQPLRADRLVRRS